MTILCSAVSGTLESSDAYIRVEPASTLEIQIESVVLAQYGDAIRVCALSTLAALNVTACHLTIKDRGALDCVLQARIETALYRAAQQVSP